MVTGEYNIDKMQTNNKTATDRDSFLTNRTLTSRSEGQIADGKPPSQEKADKNCARFAIEDFEVKNSEMPANNPNNELNDLTVGWL